jgi:nucleoside 2-deoxyribosyltransferase
MCQRGVYGFCVFFQREPLHTRRMPRIYLAGPDVFRVDAAEHFALLTAACERSGLEALAPSDGLVPVSVPDDEAPRLIYEMNMSLLRQADGVVANLMPFRGAEPDSGTVFEVGAAIALGLPVVAYGVSGAYADRVKQLGPVSREMGMLKDANGMTVEDFDLPLNLMLASSVTIAESPEEAITLMASLLARQLNA